MLAIDHIDAEPVAEVRYLNAARGGGTEVRRLAIERARARGLDGDLDAVICASDLQGIVPARGRGEARLLGIAVAEVLEELAFDGALPAAARTGVVLGGDLYSVPEANKRGGYGDVTDVWEAFAAPFAWVAGVLGNHDDLGDDRAIARLCADRAIHVLDGDIVVLDGVRIGGVSRIAGNPDKRGRRAEDDQLALIEGVVETGVDVLVLHEGPHGDPASQPGHPAIRALVEQHRVALTISGHCHWEHPLAAHPHGQLLGVDARVVVMTR